MSELWHCIGVPPLVPPCGARGDTARGAERHVKESGHSAADAVVLAAVKRGAIP